jgi:hypothetical protein
MHIMNLGLRVCSKNPTPSTLRNPPCVNTAHEIKSSPLEIGLLVDRPRVSSGFYLALLILSFSVVCARSLYGRCWP